MSLACSLPLSIATKTDTIMKQLYTKIPALCLAMLIGISAMASGSSSAKKRHRRFLKKKDIPTRVELVVGGYGEHADRYGRKDHFNPMGDFQIGVKVYTEDNRVYGTAGVGGGIFSWDNFDVKVIGGNFSHKLFNRSNVSIAHPDDVPGHKVRLLVSYKALPHLAQEIELPLDFSYSYTLREAGISGREGWEECRRAPKGSNGRDHLKCNGEDGDHGYRGVNGGLGENGAHGPDIEVVLLPYDDLNSDDMVIEARETNLRTGRTKTRWFSPKGGNLKVISRGGTGGCGGDGQAGGNGGNGGDGGREGDDETKPIMAYGGHGGHGGMGGAGGDGGAGGAGGQISIFFHPDLMDYLGSIEPVSVGGPGGSGGRGGAGGKAGCGGDGTKADGENGRKGACGPRGYSGPNGPAGPAPVWIPLEDS